MACTQDVPVTTTQEMLGLLGVGKPNHPRFKAPDLEVLESVLSAEDGHEIAEWPHDRV